MRKRKSPFTIEEHNALGKELQAIRDRLFDLCDTMYTRYSTRRDCKPAGKALSAIDALRAHLDNLLFEERWTGPADDKRLRSIYYRKTGQGNADVWLIDIMPKPITTANLGDRSPRS